MHPCTEHIDEFHKLVGDLAAIDTTISDEDQALLLLTSLPSSYDNFMETLLYGWDTLKLEDVLATLNSRKLQKMTEAKGDGGEGLYVRGRSGQIDIEQGKDSAWSKSQGKSSRLRCYICQFEEHLKRDCPRRDYLVDFKEYDGGNIMLGYGKECRVLGTVTRKTLKGRKQLGEYQTGWKIKTVDVLDFYNQMSTQQCTKSGVAKHLGVAVIQQAECVAIGFKTPIDMLGFSGWLASIKKGMLEPVKVKNMGFNESGEYKKTFIGSGVGTGSVQVLQGEVQTQDLIYYHLARDREQHSTHELFSYREDSNEAAFVVAEAEKIDAHESLTFNNTVVCDVIFKWKAGLKDDMDAWSDVYVLSNGCKKCSDDNDVYYWEYTPAKGNVLGMEIVRDQSGNTLRVSQSKFYNGKFVQALLEGHSILSLEGSLSGDCDVEKNGKWSCIYAVGIQEYQMVCTRLDITSADVEAAKEGIWLKGLAIESGFELKIVAVIATGALSKAIPGPRVLKSLGHSKASTVFFLVAAARFQLGLELVYFPPHLYKKEVSDESSINIPSLN
ncbi:hypothetical protein Tco_0737030 [Tanacetum coccineum]